MHRSIDLTVPAEAASQLIKTLREVKGVVGLSHHPGASLVPPGDQLTVHVLNRDADTVLKAVASCCAPDRFSAVSAEVASISDAEKQAGIDSDVDEAIWEELETGLRHQGQLTPNFLFLMALGGIIGAVATVAPGSIALTAFVASAIITPGFEPIAKLPLGAILRRWDVVKAGLKSAAVGYGVLIAAAAVTWALMAQIGIEPSAFLEGEPLKDTLDPSLEIIVVAVAGAFAGIVILAAYRRSVIAGALVAMRLIEAASVGGVAIAMGRFDLAVGALERLLLDTGFVIVAGLIVFGLKQTLVHRRTPLR
jgi:hypothetical protein